MVLALAQGAAIKFWHQASRGTTLGRLHDIYESGFLVGALKRILVFRFNLIALACLLAAISTLRGPLFQRASSIDDRAPQILTGDANLEIAQLIPTLWVKSSQLMYSPEFLSVLDDYTKGKPASLGGVCNNCTFSVKVSCARSSSTNCL